MAPKNSIFSSIFSGKIFVFSLCFILCGAHRCDRVPRREVSRIEKQSGDGGYQVLINKNPTGYAPGRIYNGKFDHNRSTKSKNELLIRLSFFL